MGVTVATLGATTTHSHNLKQGLAISSMTHWHAVWRSAALSLRRRLGARGLGPYLQLAYRGWDTIGTPVGWGASPARRSLMLETIDWPGRWSFRWLICCAPRLYPDVRDHAG